MFRKNKNGAPGNNVAINSQEEGKRIQDDNLAAAPVYPKPKILLIDLKDESEKALKELGYNVHVGTFGSPYLVRKSNTYEIIPTDYKVPNYAEQEIAILDLAPNTTLSGPTAVIESVEGNDEYWAKCNDGIIDPRPIASHLYQSAFDTIVSHGGVFVIFAAYPGGTDITYARLTNNRLQKLSDGFQLWSFLAMLHSDRFRLEFSEGSEIESIESSTLIGKLVTRHLNGARFNCIFEPREYTRSAGARNRNFEPWIPLAINKYGEPVAGVFVPQGSRKGLVLLLPQLARKSEFLIELLRDVLPEVVPSLFPYSESKRWINNEDYQVEEVLQLRHKIEVVKAKAQEQVKELENQITSIKDQTAYLQKLLTETGEPLVKAVEQTLKELGFNSVVDADEEVENAGGNGSKREDLRIVGKPTLLIEVKGINGLPTDADSLQVQKYVVVRMREWKNTEIHGLEIINHQRGVPPLNREHDKPFREDILVNAEEQQFGLITTWDLFRLARSARKLGWSFEQIQPLFFSFGRIQAVPVHYKLVGVTEHFWERIEVVGIRLSAELMEGDCIAFELPVEYEEQVVESLQVDNQQVKLATKSSLTGVKTRLAKAQLRNGTRVYCVNRDRCSRSGWTDH